MSAIHAPMFSGGSLGDPYWDNVVLLLHFNGTDESTTFVDEKLHSISAVGNAQIDTSVSKFGGASGKFDGTGDYLSTPDSNDLDLGDVFTAEWFVKSSTNSLGYAFNKGKYIVPFGGGWEAVTLCVRGNIVYFRGAGYTEQSISPAFDDFILDDWNHIAVVRDGSSADVYINGSIAGSATGLVTGVTPDNFPVYIGAFVYYESNGVTPIYECFTGELDELRITKGIARYTSNFTPPTAPFPNS